MSWLIFLFICSIIISSNICDNSNININNNNDEQESCSKNNINGDSLCEEEQIFVQSSTTNFKDPKMSDATERTFIMVKPDGVQRGLVGEIIRRFEQRGFKLVGLKLLQAQRALLESHYEEHKGKKFYEPLLTYIGSGPVVAMVWEGLNVVAVGRKMLGATDPAKSEPGTIRGDFAIVTGRNIAHGSDSEKSAQREISLWFRADELANWPHTAERWIYE